MRDQPTVIVTKLNAGERQILAGINMVFRDDDIIATHTVVCAGHQVLVDLADQGGLKPFSIRSRSIASPKTVRTIRTHLASSENFFKHADRDADPNATINHNPTLTHFFLYDSLLVFQDITGELRLQMKIYAVWFAISYPEALSDTELHTFVAEHKKLFPPPNRLDEWAALDLTEVRLNFG